MRDYSWAFPTIASSGSPNLQLYGARTHWTSLSEFFLRIAVCWSEFTILASKELCLCILCRRSVVYNIARNSHVHFIAWKLHPLSTLVRVTSFKRRYVSYMCCRSIGSMFLQAFCIPPWLSEHRAFIYYTTNDNKIFQLITAINKCVPRW